MRQKLMLSFFFMVAIQAARRSSEVSDSSGVLAIFLGELSRLAAADVVAKLIVFKLTKFIKYL